NLSLYHPGTHPDLLSLPTRRSSDLTTSGVAWEPAIKFCQQVLGPDRVLYAMDYPYQQSYDEVAAYDRMDMEPDIRRMLMEGNARDRKSTRLNSSHVKISDAVFCLIK